MSTNGVTANQSVAMVRTEDRSAMRAFEPQDMGGLVEFAKVLHASGLLPKAINKWEAAVAIAIRGRELGLTTMQAFSSIHIIEGKVVLSGDLIVAMVKRSPECKYLRLVDCTNERCTYETLRVGDTEPTRITWSIDDAKQAGLAAKDNWRKYPRAMLRARCGAEISRAVYPDLAMGMYDPDEIATPGNGMHVAAPPRHDEMTGEVIESTPSIDFRGELSRISREGTAAEANALFAQMAKANLPANEREELRGIARATMAAIKARSAAPVAVVDDPYGHSSDDGPRDEGA